MTAASQRARLATSSRISFRGPTSAPPSAAPREDTLGPRLRARGFARFIAAVPASGAPVTGRDRVGMGAAARRPQAQRSACTISAS